MKKTYDDIVNDVLAPGLSDQERAAIYQAYPEYRAQLQELVDTASKLELFQTVQPDGRAALRALLNMIALEDLAAVHEPTAHRRGFMHWLSTKTMVYVPLAALVLIVLGGGIVVLRSRTTPSSPPTTSSAIVPAANGSVANANTAVLQDNTSEQTIATGSDGSSDVYAASASSLQQLGSSTNENF